MTYEDAQTADDALIALLAEIDKVEPTYRVHDVSFGRRRVDKRGWYWGFSVTYNVGPAQSRLTRENRDAVKREALSKYRDAIERDQEPQP
jgi:hypothetical protein